MSPKISSARSDKTNLLSHGASTAFFLAKFTLKFFIFALISLIFLSKALATPLTQEALAWLKSFRQAAGTFCQALCDEVEAPYTTFTSLEVF